MISSNFNKELLKGKVVLITGGASGINFGIATLLGQHGASLVLMGRRQNILDQAKEILNKQAIQVHVVQGDVRLPESAQKAIQETVNHFRKLDILINGAAGNFLCSAESLSTNPFKTLIDIDLIGTFNMCRAAFDELKKTKGNILNISATLHYTSTPWQVHASSAKAGVDTVTKSLAVEWGKFGIRVNGIAPGAIKETEGVTRLALGINPEELEKIISETIPLQRMGTKTDIGNAALFLVSDTAGYVTGKSLLIFLI